MFYSVARGVNNTAREIRLELVRGEATTYNTVLVQLSSGRRVLFGFRNTFFYLVESAAPRPTFCLVYKIYVPEVSGLWQDTPAFFFDLHGNTSGLELAVTQRPCVFRPLGTVSGDTRAACIKLTRLHLWRHRRLLSQFPQTQ